MNARDHLSDLLQWTQARIGSKVLMQERFGYLLHYFFHEIDFPIIKVAGTNGKGSVCAMLSACLSEAGKKVGLFTSPHLIAPTERFRIGAEEILTSDLDQLAQQWSRRLQTWVHQHGPAYTPSFFESLLLIGLDYFTQKKIDIAIFEAGVGGENDAVSLLPDFFSVLTNVGMDHHRQLGNTLEAIAKDKAGIARSGTLIVNSRMEEKLKKIIRQRARENRVEVLESKNYIHPASDDNKICIEIGTDRVELAPSLKGTFQTENINLVLSAYQFLLEHGQLSSWIGISGLEKAYWPGRFEQLGTRPRWLIDAAHNEPGLSALKGALDSVSNKADRILIYGNSEEKDYPELLKLVPSLADEVYLVDDFYKAVPASILKKHLDPGIRILAPDTLPLALEHVQKYFPDHLIVVTGSIFMIGKARKWILQHGLD